MVVIGFLQLLASRVAGDNVQILVTGLQGFKAKNFDAIAYLLAIPKKSPVVPPKKPPSKSQGVQKKITPVELLKGVLVKLEANLATECKRL
jgi:hypothetical protein